MKIVRNKISKAVLFIVEDTSTVEFINSALSIDSTSIPSLLEDDYEIISGVDRPDVWIGGGVLSYDDSWAVLNQEVFDTKSTELEIILQEYKLEKKKEAASIRYQHEVNHPTLDTSRDAQGLITGAWATCQMNPDAVIDFKATDGSWSQLTKTEIDPLALAVTSWVQACFSHEKTLCDLIDAASTKEEVDSVDLNEGWPQ